MTTHCSSPAAADWGSHPWLGDAMRRGRGPKGGGRPKEADVYSKDFTNPGKYTRPSLYLWRSSTTATSAAEEAMARGSNSAALFFNFSTSPSASPSHSKLYKTTQNLSTRRGVSDTHRGDLPSCDNPFFPIVVSFEFRQHLSDHRKRCYMLIGPQRHSAKHGPFFFNCASRCNKPRSARISVMFGRLSES